MRTVRRLGGDLFDLAAIGAPLLAVLLVPMGVAVAVAGAWELAVVVLVVVIAVAVLTALPRRPVAAWPGRPGGPGGSDPVADPAAGAVTVMAVNVFDRNRSMERAARELAGCDADVLVVSEAGAVVDAIVGAAFPFREVVSIGGARGHAVYSKLPLVRLADPPVMGPSLHLRVSGPFEFDLLAVHLPRPTVFGPTGVASARPHVCRGNVSALAGLLADRPDVMVAGDLNLCDRQLGYRRLVGGRRDAMRWRWARSTFHGRNLWWFAAMRIDHLVVPEPWHVHDARVVPIPGSDHRGIRATVSTRGSGGRGRTAAM